MIIYYIRFFQSLRHVWFGMTWYDHTFEFISDFDIIMNCENDTEITAPGSNLTAKFIDNT